MTFPITVIRPPWDADLWPGVEPPEYLHVQGRPGASALFGRLPSRGVAVVGSRSPTVRTPAPVREWIRALTGRDPVVVSGFARGTDAAAHEAAVDSGLPTVAVLGAGIDVDYPAGHSTLRRRVLAAGGLVVTEFPPGTPPRASNFHRRNRLIAAWSNAVVVAQAAARSGALNTAGWARKMGRTCFAVPCPPGDPFFAGNQRLIDHEAALPFWHAHSLGAVWLDLATLDIPASRPVGGASGGGDPDRLARAVAELSRESGGARFEAAFDRVAGDLAWSPSRFHAALATLVRSGRLREESGVLFPNSRNQTRNPARGESVKS